MTFTKACPGPGFGRVTSWRRIAPRSTNTAARILVVIGVILPHAHASNVRATHAAAARARLVLGLQP